MTNIVNKDLMLCLGVQLSSHKCLLKAQVTAQHINVQSGVLPLSYPGPPKVSIAVFQLTRALEVVY